MPPEEPMADGEGDEGIDAPEGEDSHYAAAGRTIRHAISDGDDEALARAICDLIDIHEGDEGKEEEEGSKEKPNLAMLLLGKKKR